MENKMRLKKGDKVRVIAGKDKGKEGKILAVYRETRRVIVEGVSMATKHKKAGRNQQKGGIIHQETSIHVSNVMFLADGKPTRIGYKVSTELRNGKEKNVKVRIAKSTGDAIN